MLSKFRSRLTYANIVSSLCLFLVLGGGTAFAVTAIDDDSVFSRHIVNGEVKGGDLAPNAVGSGKVIDDSLTGNDVSGLGGGDINDGSLAGAELADGSVGASQLGDLGVTTPKLADGAVNSDKLGTFAVSASKIFPRQVTNPKIGTDAVDARTIKPFGVRASELGNIVVRRVEGRVGRATAGQVRLGSATSNCTSSEQVISGGFAGVLGGFDFKVSESRMNGNGWTVAVQNKSTDESVPFDAEAYCLSP